MSEDSNLKRSRASGEVLDYLLREFDVNQNPNPDQRKDISERTGMTEKAVRIWFQNRRAKLRKFERMGKPVKLGGRLGISPRGITSGPTSRSNLLTNISVSALDQHSEMPNELNDKYCFIDCSSLSVGSWQRIKSGQHDHQALKTSLINLSPFTLDQFMNTVDLMVILSKKNNEVNYFFAAISNNSKILFRIFYPISSIISSSLLDSSVSKDFSELKLKLSQTPKFSVYFFSGINSNLNQWSICDDFSEAQQVSSAYFAPGGSSIPHVLVGSKTSLEFLLNFVKSQNEHQVPGFQSVALPHYEHDHKGNHIGAPEIDAFEPIHAPEPKASFTVSHDSHESNDFNLKHDVDWHQSPQDEQDFSMKGISPLGEFHNGSRSPSTNLSTDTKYLTGIGPKQPEIPEHSSRKPENEYTDIFNDSPDFFNAVQTPGSHQVPTHHSIREHDHLINSPSTNVHSFVNSDADTHVLNDKADKDIQSELQESSSLYAAPDFNPAVEEQTHAFSDETPHTHEYEFATQIPGSEFQTHGLLPENQSMTNNAPTSGPPPQAAHEDQFIDYNGDA